MWLNHSFQVHAAHTVQEARAATAQSPRPRRSHHLLPRRNPSNQRWSNRLPPGEAGRTTRGLGPSSTPARSSWSRSDPPVGEPLSTRYVYIFKTLNSRRLVYTYRQYFCERNLWSLLLVNSTMELHWTHFKKYDVDSRCTWSLIVASYQVKRTGNQYCFCPCFM